ncbi:MAG: hypothetical protein HGN29_15185 [Asgard group archaeon]|nr:hypothetical protein [Asgard group archaeon]
MSEYSEYMKQAKEEVELCLDIWKNIFEENYSATIDYAYSKGSAVKKWDTFIDYVPILSDVDIHIKTREYSDLFQKDDSFYESVNLSELYESTFIERNPNYFHIPRVQIIHLNHLLIIRDFIQPKLNEITLMIGKPEEMEKPSIEFIRETDKKELLKLEEFLSSLPMSMIDRTGLDLWVLVRRMLWRVSPSPIRLLSQLHDTPLDLWEMNRTKISEELEKYDYVLLAENYKDYYYEGWIGFMEGFSNSQTLRRIISSGYDILKICFEEIQSLDEREQLF